MTLANEETNDSNTNITHDTITHFIDDHLGQTNVPVEPSNNDFPESMDNEHSIIEFLQRPVLIDKIQITDTGNPLQTKVGTKQTPIWKKDFPSSLIKIQSKLQKLQNFAFIKCDIKIKMTINCNPMVSGKLMLVYSPYEYLTPSNHKLIGYPRKTISAYPNCFIDVQLDTSVELTIPFLSYKEAYNLVSDDVDYVTLFLFPVTFLRTPSKSNPVTINVFASFDNITLYGPTCNEISDSYLSPKQQYLRKISKLHECQLKQIAEIQMKTETGKGIISEIASTVSGVSGKLKGIPIIGEAASQVKWVSDVVGNVASIFGFSKPTSTSENSKISNIPGYGSTHLKSIDQSNSLALNNDYKLGDQENIFQTNIDEMEIEYVCNNPGIEEVTSWTSGTDFFHEFPVTIPKITTGSANNTLLPWQFCGQFFEHWRATVCFKVSVAKTVFHSGRLEMYFNVGQKAATPTAARMTEDASNCFRAILDLTNDTEITIKIPYISYLLWLSKGDNMGYFKIRNMGDLVYNSNVSDTIDLVIYSWAENVMFMDPDTVFLKPSDLTPTTKAEIQIQLVNKATPNVVVFGKLGNEKDLNHKALLMCGGDYVENFRPMTRIFQHYKDIKTGDIVPLNLDNNSTYINVLQHIYKMRRGGLRIKAFSLEGDYTILHSQLHRSQSNRVNPYHYTFPKINPVHEIAIPFYTKYRRIINNITPGVSDVDTYDLPDIIFHTDKSFGDVINLFKAGDDDFSLGWLVGIPPMDGAPSEMLVPVSKNVINHVVVDSMPTIPHRVNHFDAEQKLSFTYKRDDDDKTKHITGYMWRGILNPTEGSKWTYNISDEPYGSVKYKFYTTSSEIPYDLGLMVDWDQDNTIKSCFLNITYG